MRKMLWPVEIQEADNGYVVCLGCKKLVFTSKLELFRELEAYIEGRFTVMSEELKKEAGMPSQQSAVPEPQDCPTKRA